MSKRSRNPKCTSTHYCDHWEAPPPGVVKSNINVTVSQEEGEINVGIVISDSRGRFIRAEEIHVVVEAHCAEAYAAKVGLEFAKRIGVASLILEGDAKTIMESFSNSVELFYTRLILLETYNLASKFQFVMA